MRLEDMSAELISMQQQFNDQLDQAGWEITDFSEMFSAGMSVNPEGIARRQQQAVTLEVHLDLEKNEIRLFILDRPTDQLVRLALSVSKHFNDILALLIEEQDRLNTKSFPQFLIQSSRFIDQAWFIDHEGSRFLLDIPGAENT